MASREIELTDGLAIRFKDGLIELCAEDAFDEFKVYFVSPSRVDEFTKRFLEGSRKLIEEEKSRKLIEEAKSEGRTSLTEAAVRRIVREELDRRG